MKKSNLELIYNIIHVSFIGRGNRNIPKETFIISSCIEYTWPWIGIKFVTLAMIDSDCIISMQTTIRTHLRLLLNYMKYFYMLLVH